MLPLNNIKNIFIKKLAYILIVITSLTGCKKCKKDQLETTVSGLIRDKVTGNTIANADVYLIIVNFGDAGVSSSTADKTTSDAYGRYNFEFKALEGKDYYLMGRAPNYFVTASVTDFPIQEGNSNVKMIYLKPIATIKIHVKKTDMSYDSLDSWIHLEESGTSRVAFGKQVDTNLFYTNQVAGLNKDIYIQKFIGTSLVSGTSYTHTAYFIPVDTTYINLNY